MIFNFQNVISRALTALVRSRLALFPALTLVGPRQCGKTTLASLLARRYFNLEDAEARRRLDARWNEVVADPSPVVFDEAQNWPELFNRLRGVIDADRKRNGRFILLGSVSPALMREVSESLAGRMAVIKSTRQVLLCRVGQSVTTGDRWVTSLEDYLAACSS